MDRAPMEAAGTAEPPWTISLLGGLRAARPDGVAIERFQTRSTAALLARLAFPPLRAHERERLADALWPDAPAENARRSLSQAASWLRKRLEPDETGEGEGGVLLADRQTLGLRPGAVRVDVAEFEAALRAAERGSGDGEAARADALREAVALYGGELLPGFYDDWVLAERRRLADAYLRALRRLVAYSEERGDAGEALRYADAALAADPLDEAAHADRIRLLAAAGRIDAALAQYETLERMLLRDRGDAPSPAVRELAERLRRPRGAPPPPPTPGEKPAATAALPRPLTRLFGREEEIARIEALMGPNGGARLVTLTGPGGSGKTRLAVESARRLAAARETGVAFVPLADLSDPALVAGAVAEAVRRSGGGPAASGPWATSPREFLAERLAGRPFLLVLDNLEHLLNAPGSGGGEGPVTRLVRDLLEELPALSILATSRQRLGIDGEAELPVPPLPVPSAAAVPPDPGDAASPAAALRADAPELASAGVLLFADRARAARPDFRITDDNAADVAALSARLEGIPLAIELCAAWAQALTPAQMLARLDRRFELLVSRRADIAPRHRTLHGAIEYGYQMLSPRKKWLFARLSVFQGGWTLASAEAALAPIPAEEGDERRALLDPALVLAAEIAELCDRSLVVAAEAPGLGEMRYRMLETLREFAGQQLSYAEAGALRRRHAAAFLDIAERSEEALSGPEQAAWLARLEAEHDNLRAALAWAEREDRRVGLRVAGALAPFWDTRGHLREGRDWLTRLLRRRDELPGEGEDDRLMARAWSALGRLAWSQGDLAEAKAAHEAALPLWRASGDARRIAGCLHSLGATTYRLGDYAASRVALEESLALARAGGDDADVARALNSLGNLASIDGGAGDAPRSLYAASLEAARRKGDRQLMSTALHNLGTFAGEAGEQGEAERLFREALAIRQELKDDYGLMTTLVNLGKIASQRGDGAQGRVLMTRAMDLAHGTGRKLVLAYCLREIGLMTLAEGRDADGVRRVAAAVHLSDAISAPMSPRHQKECDAALDAARARLGDAAYAAAWAAGTALPVPVLVEELRAEAAAGPDAAEPRASAPEADDRCPHCGAAGALLRHGRAPNGKQRYRCAACGKGTRENPGSAAYDAASRERILAARRDGASLRELTRRFGVSKNTVMAWLRDEPPSP